MPSGDPQPPVQAYTLICKTLEGRERRDGGRDRSRDSRERDGELSLNLLVPASQCGAIIGKEGCKIKEIRDTTGANVHVSTEPLPGRTHNSVYKPPAPPPAPPRPALPRPASCMPRLPWATSH